MHAYEYVCLCMRVYVHVYMYVYIYMYVVYMYAYTIMYARVWVYICTRVGAFCLFVLSNLSTTCACIKKRRENGGNVILFRSHRLWSSRHGLAMNLVDWLRTSADERVLSGRRAVVICVMGCLRGLVVLH